MLLHHRRPSRARARRAAAPVPRSDAACRRRCPRGSASSGSRDRSAHSRSPASRPRNGRAGGPCRGRAPCARPPARTSTRRPTVVVINGDVPLITPEAIHGARGGARGVRRRRATVATMEPEDPDAATGVSCATPRRRRADRRDQGRRRRRRPGQLAIREVNTGVYAFDGGSAARRARPASSRTTRRASCTCPTCCPKLKQAGTAHPRPCGHRLDDHARDQRPRRPREGDKLAQQRIHERHQRAGARSSIRRAR